MTQVLKKDPNPSQKRQKTMSPSKSRLNEADSGKKGCGPDKSPSPMSDKEIYRKSEEQRHSSQRSPSPLNERRRRHKRTTRRRSPSYSPRREEREAHREEESGACRCLGVFGLSSYTEERDLKEIFGAYGDIEKICLIYDKQSGHSKGFGFIYFESIEDAITARKETQGLVLDGRHIRVDYSLTLEPHPSTPGRYQGRQRYYRGNRSSSLRNRNDYYNRPHHRDRSYDDDAYERKRYGRDEYDDHYDRSRKYSSSSRVALSCPIASPQSLDLWGRRGDLRAEEAVFFRHASLSEADLTSSYIAIPVHSLMLSHQAFFCRPRLRLPSTVPWRIVLERLLCLVTCPNQASFRRFTVASKGSCGPTYATTNSQTDSFVT
ncbi:transformer-2 protein homolog beta [Elysia marginata]|uniref:Transformer-2 protein homolog beta n=1 Tax=Elysia marginata TaxID=1093978 RepID=A0AAV4H3L4_9GAST|nr:transformer-2 protein homolog beta [Elysia marginata]